MVSVPPYFSSDFSTHSAMMFPFRSFFFSLFFGNLLLVGLVLVVGFLIVRSDINGRFLQKIDRFQNQLLLVIQSEFQEYWPNIEKRRIEQYWHPDTDETGIRLTLIDSEGRVLGDSAFPAIDMEPHLTPARPEIIHAMAGHIASDVRLSRTTNIEYRFLAAPIVYDGEVVAVVRLAFPVTLRQEHRSATGGSLPLIFLCMFLAGVFLSLIVLHRLWYKPLRLLNSEARRIAEGLDTQENFIVSHAIDSPLELAQMSQSLEAIRKTVSGQIETISRQREGLQTILHHHPDAIFAMNRAAEVIYCNDTAKKLFRFDSVPEHSFLQKIVRSAPIIDWYLECRRTVAEQACDGRNTPPVERRDVDLFGRKHCLELEFVLINTQAHEDAASLVIISNMTEIVQTEKMKTDFVANASHELRTPLAAIRSALDNVSDDVFENKELLQKIIQIVDRHASRLDALIEDLLALHGVEEETLHLTPDETSVAEQRSWIEELFQCRIEEKQIHLTVTSDFDDRQFIVDNKRLGLILQNLLDNAIKFSPFGGSVSLTFRREGIFLIIECRDNGFGIPAEDQRRVFERFYQGDSARSGDGRLRGTGLGLAIVKHAVERLKGSITLDSRTAQGCLFSVRIPNAFS